MSLYREESSAFWWARFQVNGKPYRVSTGKTNKTEARYEEERLRAEARANPPEPRSGVGAKEGTLLDLCGLDVDRAINEGAKKDVVTPTLTAVWAPIMDFFGPDYHISALTTVAMDDYVTARRNWKKKHPKTGEIYHRRIAGQTIRREIAALKRACIIAKKRKWLKQIPEEFPRLRKDPKNVALSGKLRAPELLQQLLADANDRRLHGKRDSTVRDHLLFCVLTGLRAEELQKVDEKWVERAPPGITEVPAILRPPESGTKTGEERFVGIPQEGLDIIERRKEIAKTRKDGLLFPHKSVGQWLRRYCGKMGIKPAITLRDLRHTYSTLGMHGTSDATAVQSAMGHTDLRTTQVYQSSTIARVAAVSVAVAKSVLGTPEVVRPKLSDTKVEAAKYSFFQDARLAQLDRALVSEADEIAIFKDFLARFFAKTVQETLGSCQIDLSDTAVRSTLAEVRRIIIKHTPPKAPEVPMFSVTCSRCGRVSEAYLGPTYECAYCGVRALPESVASQRKA